MNGSLENDAVRAEVAGIVIALAQGADDDALARIGRVDETSAADVNTDVRDLAAGAEEHEVARHQLAAADMLAVVIILRRRRARDVEAEVAVDILHEAGAVSTTGKACSSPYIWVSNKLCCIGYNRRAGT